MMGFLMNYPRRPNLYRELCDESGTDQLSRHVDGVLLPAKNGVCIRSVYRTRKAFGVIPRPLDDTVSSYILSRRATLS